jgi:cytosine deaminase
MDPWYSLGKADMLEVAAMGLHVGQLSSRAEMKWCFDAVTVNSAKIMGFEHYELQKNGRANMVLLQARNKIEAVRLKANRLLVIRDGKLIAQNDPVTTKLFMGGRPNLLNPADYETS